MPRGRPRKIQIPTEKWTITYIVMGSKDKKGKYQDYKVVRNQDNQLKFNCLAFFFILLKKFLYVDNK